MYCCIPIKHFTYFIQVQSDKGYVIRLSLSQCSIIISLMKSKFWYAIHSLACFKYNPNAKMNLNVNGLPTQLCGHRPFSCWILLYIFSNYDEILLWRQSNQLQYYKSILILNAVSSHSISSILSRYMAFSTCVSSCPIILYDDSMCMSLITCEC